MYEIWDAWGLEHSLIVDVIRHWHGSASNVSGPPIRCSEQSWWLSFLIRSCECVLRKNDSQLPSTAIANAPIYVPIDEQGKEYRLLGRIRKRSRDLWP